MENQMIELKIFQPNMQCDIDEFYKHCFAELGWDYLPEGRHHDIAYVDDSYMRTGCFWCLYEDDILIGTVAVRVIDADKKISEMKRLYIMPGYRGYGYGEKLFKFALDYAKHQGFSVMRLDTRQDREAACHMIDKYNFKQIDKYNDNSFAELFYELNLLH
jgi:GNAT superfamily N-acetyltransferase